MEHIPSHLFDLVEHTPFHMLDATAKTEVLAYFTEQEYTMLHQAAQQARFFHQTTGITPGKNTREALLQAFDRKYPQQKKNKPLALYPVHLWKVAAIVVFCLGITLWSFLRRNSPEQIKYVSVKDTVYVASATDTAPPEKVYDTVYIRVNTHPVQPARPKSPAYQTHPGNDIQAIPGNINILRLGDKDQPANTSKGNSREEDTLLKQYPFVRL